MIEAKSRPRTSCYHSAIPSPDQRQNLKHFSASLSCPMPSSERRARERHRGQHHTEHYGCTHERQLTAQPCRFARHAYLSMRPAGIERLAPAPEPAVSSERGRMRENGSAPQRASRVEPTLSTPTDEGCAAAQKRGRPPREPVVARRRAGPGRGRGRSPAGPPGYGASSGEHTVSPPVLTMPAVSVPSRVDDERTEVEPPLGLGPGRHRGRRVRPIKEESFGIQRRVEVAVREDAGVEEDLVASSWNRERRLLGERAIAERLRKCTSVVIQIEFSIPCSFMNRRMSSSSRSKPVVWSKFAQPSRPFVGGSRSGSTWGRSTRSPSRSRPNSRAPPSARRAAGCPTSSSAEARCPERSWRRGTASCRGRTARGACPSARSGRASPG